MKSSRLSLLLLAVVVISINVYVNRFFNAELTAIENNVSQARQVQSVEVLPVINTQDRINEIPLLVSKFVTTDSPLKKEYLEKKIKQLLAEGEGERVFSSSGKTGEEQAIIQYLHQNWLAYKNSVLKTIYSERSGEGRQAREDMEASLVLLERVNSGMKMLIDYHQRTMTAKIDEASAVAGGSRSNVNGLTVLSSLFFLAMAVGAYRKIGATENALQQQVQELDGKNQLLQEQTAEIHRLAYYDVLTGLPNRLSFQQVLQEELEAAKQQGLQGAVLFLDMDNFKLVNDTYGHDMGDRFLTIIAQRIGELAQGRIFAARFGGDEFAMLLRGYGEAEVNWLLPILAQQIAERLDLDAVSLYPSCSSGVALFPQHGDTAGDLLKKADIALYQAKQRKVRHVIFEESILTKLTQRHDLELKMRQAIIKRELTLVYQPILDLHTRRLVGLEGLLRWEQSKDGNISPAVLIPLAEATGFIIPIGRWVIEEAAAMLHRLRMETAESVFLSINVSVMQLNQEEFLEHLLETVAMYGLDPGRFRIEITESILIESFQQIGPKLEAVRKAGIKVCLDDFGTGYSSINYLTKLPIDYLKLDRTLIQDLAEMPRLQTVFQNLICMAHGIGIQVVAEGIETVEQVKLIEKMRCDYGQGYLFSRPVGETEFMAMVRQSGGALRLWQG